MIELINISTEKDLNLSTSGFKAVTAIFQVAEDA
jgi:hypothetical protein